MHDKIDTPERNSARFACKDDETADMEHVDLFSALWALSQLFEDLSVRSSGYELRFRFEEASRRFLRVD